MPTPASNAAVLPRRAGTAALLVLALGLTACASTQPVIYSKKSGSIELNERTRQDLGDCSRQADVRVGRNVMKGPQGTPGTQKVGQKVGSTGAIAFVATAAGSVVGNSKNAWERARGAAAGGAAGMATKLLLEWNEGDKVYQRYVESCLEERGHEVLGWR
jgi:hypothetical protein